MKGVIEAKSQCLQEVIYKVIKTRGESIVDTKNKHKREMY